MHDNREIWRNMSLFHSTNFAQQLLYNCYKKQGRKDASKKSYANSYPFIYYLEHGENFYITAQNAPLSIKPMLLFYGMVQLLKACLLTVDAEYPESTLVLAHGVSTRKRKKQNYEFFDDEVKVQKHGLFTHFSEKMFHVKHLTGEKFQMITLLKRICELHELFSLYYRESLSLRVIYNSSTQSIMIPTQILDHYHMTLDRFTHYITKQLSFADIVSVKEQEKNYYVDITINQNLKPLDCEPLMFEMYQKSFKIPLVLEEIFALPEVIAHYLLLYNLSMISRYETEWWNELLHSYASDAYPFIVEFLSISASKVPFLLHLYLMEKFEGYIEYIKK